MSATSPGLMVHVSAVFVRACAVVCVLVVAAVAVFGDGPSPGVLEDQFAKEVRPLLERYCFACHSTEKHKGDMDLERFARFDDFLRHPKAWQQVSEQLALGEMPPKGKPGPTPTEREGVLHWIEGALDQAALARADDPGPVVLRRLNNAEYTYSVRDLTGIDSLDPVKEFPADSAAGEGFMNTGNSLVMSPGLLSKYLEAAKEIAGHAVLLPDGFRFSAKNTRRDWTEEILTEIRQFYRQYTATNGADKVNLQGIVFETNAGGRLPLEAYLRAALEWRRLTENASDTRPPLSQFAAQRGLSPKYLESLWDILHRNEPSLLLNELRAHWQHTAPEDAGALSALVVQWQKALWKFSSVGHIGKAGGPKAWMEPVNPIQEEQAFRLKLPRVTNSPDLSIFLAANRATPSEGRSWVLWNEPRLVTPGCPDLLLRDARRFLRAAAAKRDRVFSFTARCLSVLGRTDSSHGSAPADDLAPSQGSAELRFGIEAEALEAWRQYLGLGPAGTLPLHCLRSRIESAGGFDFVQGWGSSEPPNVVANASDQAVRIPGTMKPHGIAVHPSPKLNVGVAWRSPLNGTVQVHAEVTPAHPECGNGIEWFLELRRGRTRQRLAQGLAQGSKTVRVTPPAGVGVQSGDYLDLVVGARDGNHACDLTDLEFTVLDIADGGNQWSLTEEVSSSILTSNPHPDKSGRQGIWRFFTESVSGPEHGFLIPAGSLLARWQSAADGEEKQRLAEALQALLVAGPPPDPVSPDAALYQQLASLGGPFLRAASDQPTLNQSETGSFSPVLSSPAGEKDWALDPAAFGTQADGPETDASSLCVQAPSVIEIRLPADLVAGSELVTTGRLHPKASPDGCVQLQVTVHKPETTGGWSAGEVQVVDRNGAWTSDNRRISHATPMIAQPGSAAWKRVLAGFDAFRQWFPAALCYEKIVPVDEVVTLTLFYRQDEPLCRLFLDQTQKARLDQLWDQLHYVSRDAFTSVDAFEQIWQFATQDADPKVFEPLRQPIRDRAAVLQRRLLDTEPRHLDHLLQFASRAYRRPLRPAESDELRSLYRKLRQEEIPHEDAFRLTLARVLVAPAFLYRLETAPTGAQPRPISDWELASRLSYFLWSSAPDQQLRELAVAGCLHDPDVLAAQARRLLAGSRVSRFAKEFGCAWLHLYDFDEFNEKSERHFPEFADLRGAMLEEAVQYFTDLFQHDGSVLALFDSDYTFLDQALAAHYGIPGVSGTPWRRVDGVRKYGRGGVLGFAAVLSKEAGASRTSPILRGNWVAEVLLGDKLPRPPKDVPRLPEEETAETLTVRQLVERHSSDARCASCHRRIDGFGFALESYDAIGRARTKDFAGRLVETQAALPDGTQVKGATELREYLVSRKGDVLLRQFCRKLLGYSLGRGVLLSDRPLLAEMQRQLREHEYRFSAAVEAIVRSHQFREIRGQDAPDED